MVPVPPWPLSSPVASVGERASPGGIPEEKGWQREEINDTNLGKFQTHRREQLPCAGYRARSIQLWCQES